MKNQYFGDINDYRKYGLLRGLAAEQCSILVNWMLTPDDGRADGKFIGYLDQASKWRHIDPELFDALRVQVKENGAREVSSVAAGGLLSKAAFVESVVPDDLTARQVWFRQTVELSSTRDLVFFDPDNGIEVPSVPKGRRGSSKYVYWDELEQVWGGGTSLLVYQHYPRVEREVFAGRIADNARERLGPSSVSVLKTSNVAFFLMAQETHAVVLERGLNRLAGAWAGQITVQRL